MELENNPSKDLQQIHEGRAIQENEDYSLLDRAPWAVIELSPQGAILRINKTMSRLCGYSSEELSGRVWIEALFSEEQKKQAQDLYKAGLKANIFDYELELQSKTGKAVFLKINTVRQYDAGGKLDRVILQGENTTQLKIINKALEESEERYRLMVSNVKDYAIFSLNPNGEITSWNAGAENIKGYKAEEILGKNFSIFYPPEARAENKPQRALKRAALAGRYEDEGWRVRKDGSRFWASVVITALFNDNGNLVGYSKVVRDISNRKAAAEELNRQTGFVKLLQEIAMAANEAESIESAMQFSLDRICSNTGWKIGHSLVLSDDVSSEMISTHIWHLDDPQKYARFKEISEELKYEAGVGLPGSVLANSVPEWIPDILKYSGFRRKALAQESGLVSAAAIPVMAGKSVVGILEFYNDQTIEPDQAFMEIMAHIGTQLGRVVERKHSEEALKQSEARFRTIFENAPLGIELITLDKGVVASNPALIKILGYNEEDIKNSVNVLSDVADNPAGNSSLMKDFQDGKSDLIRLEKPFLRKDGHVVWGKLSVSRVHREEGLPQMVVAMLEDITERKQMEADLSELQRRLTEGREAERLHLAQELHDGPVQDLYGFSYQLKVLGEELGHGVEPEPLKELESMLQHVIRTLRGICGELRPPTLAPFGLEKAIRSHGEAFQQLHPELSMKLDLMPDGQNLPERVRLALYRIYQQTLANIARHAHAKNISVKLWLDSQQVLLEIIDDGEGFILPTRWIELARQGHLGLVGSAERAESIGGQLKIESAPGKGTTVRVIAPRHEKQGLDGG